MENLSISAHRLTNLDVLFTVTVKVVKIIGGLAVFYWDELLVEFANVLGFWT